MKHSGQRVKVVGLLTFLSPVTRWLSVGIGALLRLDKCFILFSFSYQLLF